MNDKMQDEILFDGLMDSATAYAFVKDMDELLSIEELDQQCSPTPELDNKIKKMIDKNFRKIKFKKSFNKILKITACIAIVFTVLSVVLFSVEATRNIIFNAIVQWQDKHTDIKFEDQMSQSNIYKPAYLPNGFKEMSEQPYGNGYMIVYINDMSDQIIFEQYSADTGLSSVDNEYTTYEQIQISGKTAYLFKAKTDNNFNVLILENGGMIFKLSSRINTDELISIGKNINK